MSGDKLKKPLQIYLADPVHNYIESMDNWMLPLSAMLIASYTKAAFGDRVKIRIFKFPDQLFKAIKDMPPDIIGVSNYCWNSELSKTILRFAKECSDKTITVMGGPNATYTKPEMAKMLKEAYCNYYVVGAGEHPFKCLVGSTLNSKETGLELFKSDEVHGIWYMDPITGEAVLKPVKHVIENLDEIPSPFQNGMADEFFNQGLIPMLETERGCPFSCAYCSWDNQTRHVYKYSVKRINADIDYCRKHAKDERIMINDANFGLLGNRDLEIAKFIRNSHDKYGWPGKVIVNWGQTKRDIAFETADILKGLCILRQSAQSLDKKVLNNIKRKCISEDEWEKFSKFCKKRGVEGFAELIIPLPGETKETYFKALRYLFDLGVDCINTNTLMLLEGAALNRPGEREKNKMRTGWRLMENCYGNYEGRTVIEYQEMVLATKDFSMEDFFLCRVLNWLIQMSWTLKHHDLIIRLMQSFGINPLDFFLKAINDYNKAPESVRVLFESFLLDARKEFFSTKDEFLRFYSTKEKIEFLRKGGFSKLNTHYSERVWVECSREFIDYYESIAHELIREQPLAPENSDKMISDCAKFVQERYIKAEDLTALEKKQNINEKKENFHYDILKWSEDAVKKGLWQYHYPDGVSYLFHTDIKQREVLSEHLRRFSGVSREYQMRKLQEPYQGIDKKHLLFRIERSLAGSHDFTGTYSGKEDV